MKKGDIVHIDFEAWIVENNELFDTTKEDLAKKHEIFDEKAEYKPLPIIIGGGKVVKGLDDHLLKAQVKKNYTVEVPPKNGFGERDPKLVELHSKREILRLPEFKKGDKEPYVGMKIVLNNKIGWISAITAGRIRVDFNNQYAGRTLKYKYKITDHATNKDDKIKAILEMHFGKTEDFNIKITKNDVAIKLPDSCKYDLGWFQTKYRVVQDLREYVGVNTVQFIEEYLKKVDTKKETKDSKETKDKKEDKEDREKKEAKEKKATKTEAIQEKDSGKENK